VGRPLRDGGSADTAMLEDGDEVVHPAPPYGRWKRLVRWASRWAWAAELRHRDILYLERQGAANVATLRKLQLGILQELFRDKQEKISRLQACYNERRKPLYEDLRKENPIKDAESLVQSISVMATRAESLRGQGMVWPHSDGTVQGVPGDQPNVETGEGW
jgi:hypothetical protein